MVLIDNLAPEDFGLCVYETPIIPTPERDVQYIDIRGRHGSLTKKYAYKDIVIPITFNLLKREGIKPTLREVKPWLINATKIEFADDPGFYYRVVHGDMEDIDNTSGLYGYFVCNFTCRPFQYEHSPLKSYGTTATVYYNGTIEGEPYIKVKGTGSGTLAINGVAVNLTGVSEFIEIDSESKQVYKGTAPQGTKMTGNFPKLTPGANTITLSGGLTGFDMLMREAYL